MSEQNKPITEINIVEYSESSFAVQGNTFGYKNDLRTLGGKYNAKLRGGPGWIFSFASEKKVREYIETGKLPVSLEKEKSETTTSSSFKKPQKESTQIEKPNSFATPTLTEYALLLSTINSMADKINKIDLALSFLLTDDQKKTLNTIINASPNKTKNDKPAEKPLQQKKEKEEKEIDDYGSDLDDNDGMPMKRFLGKKL